MSSISSCIMSHITTFRNPNGTEQQWGILMLFERKDISPWRVALAEVGYILTIPFSIIETAISVIAKLFSLCLPLSQERHNAMSRWLNSCVICIGWSAVDSVINCFLTDLIVTERVVRACILAGDIFRVPPEALR